MTQAFQLSQVRVDYGELRALDIGALEIAAGRITTIVGVNGSGKSTLLRLLALLLAPSTGTLTLFGEAVSHNDHSMTKLRREITLVAQYPLLFGRSVRANLAYGLRLRGQPTADRVERALERVGLAEFADRPATTLSGGETYRVALARALVLKPRILLLDEPTASIDVSRVPDLENLFAELAADGTTIVLSTHDLDQAHRLTSSVLCLDHGRVADAPRTNVLHGATETRGEATVFVAGDLVVTLPSDTNCHTISIRPDDITVSLAPIESSARNCLTGDVIRVAEDAGSVLVTADCGRPLTARLTRKSYRDLGLGVGSRVHFTFKASAVHVMDA